MVRHFRHGRRDFLFLLLLSFSICAYGRNAAKTLPSSGAQDTLRFYSPEAPWVLADLDGDHAPDFAKGQRLGRTTDGYSYRVQLQLSSDVPSSSFTVLHNNALGLKIIGVDIDGDNDTDLIISDRFFHQYIGVWLNGGKGRFVKSPAGRFSPNSGSVLAFVAVDLNSERQPTIDKQQRRRPDCFAAVAHISLSAFKGPALHQQPFEWLFHFADDPLRQRGPPTVSAV